MKVEDLINVERRLGYRYEVNDRRVEHYQWICPPCRRSLMAVAQGQLWKDEMPGIVDVGVATPSPTLGNYGPDQGPLGEEDRRNFHA